MSKWRVNYTVSTNAFKYSEGTVVFELKDREGYDKKAMRKLAKIAALEFEHQYNDNTCYKYLIDLRTVRIASDKAKVTYQLKSDYHEISIQG